MTRILIVGGGISGLALAYRLEQSLPGADVRVLEANSRVGGTIHTLSREGFRVEAGPNGFLDNNPSTHQLAQELGLGENLVRASESAGHNRFLFHRGKLHKLPTSMWSFLGSGLLSWRAKVLLMAERWRRSPRPAVDESIHDFARRRAGPEIARTLADAFVSGIFAGDVQQLSLRAAFPRLDALEREHGSVMRGLADQRRRQRQTAPGKPAKTAMWSFRDGMQQLVDGLTPRLKNRPLLGVDVRRILRGERWTVEADGRDSWSADAVVLACPGYRQSAILADLDPELAGLIQAIPYNRIAVVALGYRHGEISMSLDGFGYLTCGREGRDILGVQWCSSIYPDRAPPGTVMLRAMCGGWHRPEMVDRGDDDLLAAVRAELKRTMNVDAAPVFHHVVRWDRAIPQYHLGHLQRVSAIEDRLARHPGLYLAGNCYKGVSLNDCVEQAGLLARRIADEAQDSACRPPPGAGQ
jgi:oxygen-dependent protoporphyrinogen oxidase